MSYQLFGETKNYFPLDLFILTVLTKKTFKYDPSSRFSCQIKHIFFKCLPFHSLLSFVEDLLKDGSYLWSSWGNKLKVEYFNHDFFLVPIGSGIINKYRFASNSPEKILGLGILLVLPNSVLQKFLDEIWMNELKHDVVKDIRNHHIIMREDFLG